MLGPRDRYYTYCTPECYSAIADYYLKDRQRCGEELKDKSPLIREQFNPENPFTINAPRFVSNRGIEYMISHALKRAGVRNPKEVHMSHGFRKFFKSQAESSSPTAMKSINIELLMGHNIGVSGHYYRPTEQEVLQDYLNAVDALTISEIHRQKKRIKELEKDYLAGLGELREDFDEMKKFLVTLKKENQKGLVTEFYDKTVGTVQDEWWASDEAKEWQRSLHPGRGEE